MHIFSREMNMKIFRKWRSRYIPGARELLSSAAGAIAKAVRNTIFVSSTADGKKSSGVQICEQEDIIDQFNDEKCEKSIEEQEYGSIRGNKDIKVEITECEEEIEKYGINIEVCPDNICEKRFDGNEFEDKKCEKEIDGRDYEVDRLENIIEKNREHQNIDKITEEIINLKECKMKKDEKKGIDKNIKIMENDKFKLGFINIHSTRLLNMMEETTSNLKNINQYEQIIRNNQKLDIRPYNCRHGDQLFSMHKIYTFNANQRKKELHENDNITKEEKKEIVDTIRTLQNLKEMYNIKDETNNMNEKSGSLKINNEKNNICNTQIKSINKIEINVNMVKKNREKNIMIRKIFRDYQKTLYNKMENLHRHQINNINNNENEKTNNSQKRKRESNNENENEKKIKLAYEHNYEMQLKNKKSIGMKRNVEDNKHNYEVNNIQNIKRIRVDHSDSYEREKKVTKENISNFEPYNSHYNDKNKITYEIKKKDHTKEINKDGNIMINDNKDTDMKIEFKQKVEKINTKINKHQIEKIVRPIEGIKNKKKDLKYINTKYIKNIKNLKKRIEDNKEKEKTKINEYTPSIEKKKISNNKKNYKITKYYAIEKVDDGKRNKSTTNL